MRRETKRYTVAFVILAVLLVSFVVWNLNAGSYGISVAQVMQIFLGNGSDSHRQPGRVGLRLPRVQCGPSCWAERSRGGVSASDVFRHPHRGGPFVLGHFLRGKAGGSP